MAAPRKILKQEIFYAIERGDSEEVAMILKRYPDLVNIPAFNSMTPVKFAVSYGHLDLVKLLVESGANITQKQSNPLMQLEMTNQNHFAIAQYLLSKQADPNAPDILAKAVQSKDQPMVSLLLIHGAIYEQDFEYIDKETKQVVSKKVRYNDPDRLVQQSLDLVVSDLKKRGSMFEQGQMTDQMAQQLQSSIVKCEGFLFCINNYKNEALIQRYISGYFGDDVDDDDFKAIFKYM